MNQALGEIKVAQAADRERVRESWEQKLRPIYTSCETCFREHNISPPWEALSNYGLVQAGQPDRRNQQECPEDEFQPLETVQQRGAYEDKQRPHDNRAEDAPQQNPSLLIRVEPKRTKQEQEDEEVIDTKRSLDQIPRQKLQRRLLVGPSVQPRAAHRLCL